MELVSARESELLSTIRRQGPLSRLELGERLGLRLNTVGDIAGDLLRRRLLREGSPEIDGRGRPKKPLEIDISTTRVVGLALERGVTSVCTMDLLGRVDGKIEEAAVGSADDTVNAACSLLKNRVAGHTVAIGISTTGFMDPTQRTILTSSATLRQAPTSIEPLYQAAGDLPLVLDNDMHASACHWLMSQDAPQTQDVLLVKIRDGALGAALLVDGRPNRGCVVGGNELGHTRFFVETEACYCGQSGCMERIFSSDFVRRNGGGESADLYAVLSEFSAGNKLLCRMTDYLAMGLANAINFVRPNRLVITGEVARYNSFSQHLMERVRGFLLQPLADRVTMERWEAERLAPAEEAGWLALAGIFRRHENVRVR